MLTSTLLGKVICNKWFAWTSMHLGRSGGAFSSKTNVIHCVFSGSDVGSKLWLLCSLLHPTTKHHNRLGDNLVYPCSSVETMADCWQLTQGGSMLKCQCQSKIVGGACAELRHSAKNLRTAWSEKVIIIIGDLKKKSTGWIFIFIGWMCAHTANTHFSSNNI